MEDTDIIELFLNRSEEAIRQTDIKYSKLCFGIAWNILLNKEDSEECVNDTWLITWNEIPPKIPKILSAFLGKITRNQAIDCLRRKNAFKRPDSHMADINGELGTDEIKTGGIRWELGKDGGREFCKRQLKLEQRHFRDKVEI